MKFTNKLDKKQADINEPEASNHSLRAIVASASLPRDHSGELLIWREESAELSRK